MNYALFIKKLHEIELNTFTLNDAVKIMDAKKQVIKSILSRWVKEKKIIRLKRNYYTLRKVTSKFELQQIFQDTYVGLYSALEFYGSTNQRFNNIDLISKKKLKNTTILSTKINFNFVNKKMFFGFEKEVINNNSLFISSKEKTIIDCVYFSSKVYLTEINDFIRKEKENLNKEKIITYLNKVNSSTLNKRVGFLLEENEIILTGIKINKKLTKLNKNLSKNGKINKKWNLIINEEF
jgi:predicted transcriptional regulator of viral defense system